MIIDESEIKATPWDALAFQMPTWEFSVFSEQVMTKYAHLSGHQTVKVNPIFDKRALHEQGFYYADTLIEPACDLKRLRVVTDSFATVSKTFCAERVIEICNGAFSHGRFHRDFNLVPARADLRYNNWLKELLVNGNTYGLFWKTELAGFIAVTGSILALHAISDSYKGRGLAKYWWSAVSKDLLRDEDMLVRSSVSASNLAALNLYASLGFSFRDVKDVYHRVVR